MAKKNGEWVLITSASSGLGAEFVRQLAEKKMNIILLARREELMNILAQEVHSQFGVDTQIISQDLTQLTNPDKLLEKIGNREVGLHVMADKATLKRIQRGCVRPCLLIRIAPMPSPLIL
ncbi:MAG: SDR family NAD(P)-dependent oxidoreductase [Bacteroidetes bacterium]|nr:SDR family NAD(P)-dependent oxidoreductase [Bacteroidota bacterium]